MQKTDDSTWHSYPSSYQVGHRNVADLFLSPVLIEEKIDGSQFSFGIFNMPESEVPVLRIRSKGTEMDVLSPERMFTHAAKTVIELAAHLTPGYTYRAEYLAKPKHNVLAYSRTPNKNLILFDVVTGPNQYMTYAEKAKEAERLGLEVVPKLFEGLISSAGQFKALLDRPSILGGDRTIEGVVIKNYFLIGPDGTVLVGKYVSDQFKEKMSGAGHRTISNNTQSITDDIATLYRTEARWQKATQHLRDAGQLEGSPKDIGPILKEIGADIEKDSKADIQEALWNWAWPMIRKQVTLGCPEWYKAQVCATAVFPEESV